MNDKITTAESACNNRRILIAGSAAANTEPEKLRRAHEFVRLLVANISSAGGGLVIFAGPEPLCPDGQPLTFDWTVLRALDSYAVPGSLKTVVVTSEKVRSGKVADEHRQLLARLGARGAIDVVWVPSDVHTGGNIGDEQVARADAMIAISGGKGVADRARKIRKAGRPVLPLDLVLGSSSNDGDGAIALHRQLAESPRTLMPATGASLGADLLALSLEAPVLPLDELSKRALAMIAAELDAAALMAPDTLILTALPVELGAVRQTLALLGAPELRTSNQTRYWARRIGNQVVAVACFGSAGNVDAAGVTTELLAQLKPTAVVMVGIAAGLREKCRLGEVVLSERIIAYEGAALVETREGGCISPRAEQYRPPHDIRQALAAYLSQTDALRSRLTQSAAEVGLLLPDASTAGPIATDFVPRLATLASGEKLLRDPQKFRALRELHGKIEVGEMEAAGVANACDRLGVPYLIVRSISDFGDDKKDDRFHDLAARAAALVARDFIVHALGPRSFP